jgi:5-dehydro-4-deoxyglucarate dehydratase
MTPRDFCRSLTGVFGFPVTPLRSDLSLDLDALAANVDAMTRHPFCALVAAGGTGEVYSLTPDEVEQVVRVTVQATAGRMPVVAGTGFNVPIGVDIVKRAERAGAQCILALPPYYTGSPEAGLFDYYEAIGKASGMPLMVYSRDWAVFSPDQVQRLADRVPTLAAWKDGQGNTRQLQRIMHHVGDRLAWFGGLGDDNVPGYFSVGVQAYTSSISNISPEVSLALADAAMSGNRERLTELMRKYVHPLYAFRERVKGYEVAAMKAAMEMLGMKAGPVRPPLTNVRAQDMDELRQLMEVYENAAAEAAAR